METRIWPESRNLALACDYQLCLARRRDFRPGIVVLFGYYSSPRLAVNGTNALIMVLCAVMAFRKPSAGSKLTGVAALMLAGIWFFMYTFNNTD
jgi:hypothetical protein